MAIRAFIIFVAINAGCVLTCSRKSLFGIGPVETFSCPEDGDSPDKIFCCGDGNNEHCCNVDSGINSVVNEIANTISDNINVCLCPLPGFSSDYKYCCGLNNEYCCNSQEILSVVAIIGIAVGALVVLVVIIVLCCCCCKCCCFSHTTQHGVVIVQQQPPNPNVLLFAPPNYAIQNAERDEDRDGRYPKAPRQQQYPDVPGFNYDRVPLV